MAVSVPVPNSAWSTQRITLGSIEYETEFTFNSRDSSWRLSIRLDESELISGLKLMPNQNLTSRYKAYFPLLPEGDLYCVRTKNTNLPINRDNLGTGLDYELWYLTSEEVAAI